MKSQLLLSLALLSQNAAAFQASPAIKQSSAPPAPATAMTWPQFNDEDVEVKPRRRRLLSVTPLSSLTTLKKDERNNFNRARLLKMGITMAASLPVAFTKSGAARAATPLLVTKGGVAPLIAARAGPAAPLIAAVNIVPGPGLGLVEMPGAGGGLRGIYPNRVGGLPNAGAMHFVFCLFVVTALLHSAGDGYVKLMHAARKCLTSVMTRAARSEEEGGEMELGLPREVDWTTYSHDELDPLQKKRTGEASGFVFNPRVMLFERIKPTAKVNCEDEEAKLQKAGKFFQQEKYKQHHHPVHVARSRYENENPTYLDTLSINEVSKHDMPKVYLDTLADAKASSWDAYKHKLEGAKPVNEVDELKEEVSNLQSLMQIEQSMYQASNQALKLAVDVQTDELQQTSANDELKDFDRKLSIHEELKEFDRKAKEYEETIASDAQEMSKSKEKKSSNLAG